MRPVRRTPIVNSVSLIEKPDIMDPGFNPGFFILEFIISVFNLILVPKGFMKIQKYKENDKNCVKTARDDYKRR
jgi:hypothetical protein